MIFLPIITATSAVLVVLLCVHFVRVLVVALQYLELVDCLDTVVTWLAILFIVMGNCHLWGIL